jgi:hypothetical protein
MCSFMQLNITIKTGKCSFASLGSLTLSNLTLYEVSSSKESRLVNDNGEEKESVPHEALG